MTAPPPPAHPVVFARTVILYATPAPNQMSARPYASSITGFVFAVPAAFE
jgi:hypothetical protein